MVGKSTDATLSENIGGYMKKFLLIVFSIMLLILQSCSMTKDLSVYICDKEQYKSYFSEFESKFALFQMHCMLLLRLLLKEILREEKEKGTVQ